MYVSFDDFDEVALSKEREACFTSGTNDEKLAQYVTDARTTHSSNVSALRQTIHLFADQEAKRRLHGLVTKRLEQERKWVKHFDACIFEHKKGLTVAKLKTQLEVARKEYAKKEQTLRTKHHVDMEDLRKSCKVEYRKEFDAELKAKKKKPLPKKHWWDGIAKFFGFNKTVPKNEKPVPAPAVAKTVTETTGPKVVKDREFYLARHAAKHGKKAA